MFLTQNAADSASLFTPFDIFMLVFTVLIAIGFVRLLMARPRKNLFALGFTAVALLVFLYTDFIMIKGW